MPTSVSVQPVTGSVHVEVANGPGARARAGSGFGLQGLRERVLLAGGSLEARATDDGGWRVLAVIPALDDGAARDVEAANDIEVGRGKR